MVAVTISLITGKVTEVEDLGRVPVMMRGSK